MPTWTVANKYCVITGANTGIGRVTAVELAKQGAKLMLAGRSKDRTEPVLAEIAEVGGQAEFVPLDLSSLDSIREAASNLKQRIDGKISLLLNNAGVAGRRGATADGFELAFGVNHLGHYLWTRLLWPLVVVESPEGERQDSPSARIINVASKAHLDADRIEWSWLRQKTRSFIGISEYERSKLCNVLFTKALVRRLPSWVQTFSVHPGVIATDIWRSVPQPFRWCLTRTMRTNEAGAQPSIWLSTAEEIGAPSGTYFHRFDVAETHPLAEDEDLQEELWRRSADWCSLSEIQLSA